MDWNNKEKVLRVMLTAISTYGPLLKNASNELKNDIDVVMSALKVNYFNYKYVSNNLKYNRSVILNLRLSDIGCIEIFLRDNIYESKEQIKTRRLDPAFVIIESFVNKRKTFKHDIYYTNKDMPQYVLTYFECLRNTFAKSISKEKIILSNKYNLPLEVARKIDEFLITDDKNKRFYIDEFSYTDEKGKTPITREMMENIKFKLIEQNILQIDETNNKLSLVPQDVPMNNQISSVPQTERMKNSHKFKKKYFYIFILSILLAIFCI